MREADCVRKERSAKDEAAESRQPSPAEFIDPATVARKHCLVLFTVVVNSFIQRRQTNSAQKSSKKRWKVKSWDTERNVPQ